MSALPIRAKGAESSAVYPGTRAASGAGARARFLPKESLIAAIQSNMPEMKEKASAIADVALTALSSLTDPGTTKILQRKTGESPVRMFVTLGDDGDGVIYLQTNVCLGQGSSKKVKAVGKFVISNITEDVTFSESVVAARLIKSTDEQAVDLACKELAIPLLFSKCPYVMPLEHSAAREVDETTTKAYTFHPRASRSLNKIPRLDVINQCIALRDAARALAEFHRRGYAYLDFKPQHILYLEEEKRWVLADLEGVTLIKELKEGKFIPFSPMTSSPEFCKMQIASLLGIKDRLELERIRGAISPSAHDAWSLGISCLINFIGATATMNALGIIHRVKEDGEVDLTATFTTIVSISDERIERTLEILQTTLVEIGQAKLIPLFIPLVRNLLILNPKERITVSKAVDELNNIVRILRESDEG